MYYLLGLTKLFVVIGSGALAACFGGLGDIAATYQSAYSAPKVVGRIEAEDIKESSGLTASECQDVLWTHNDAGNDAFIFAMAMDGRHMGAWRVQNAQNIDWESIASHRDRSGKCFLLIGDIGDNDETRTDVAIYRIPEPVVSTETASSSTKTPLQTAAAEVLRFAYADRPNNAEVLLVHPSTDHIYVVTKKKSGPAGVHRLAQVFGSNSQLKTERVSEISAPSNPPGLFTGGSISPDGKRLMLCDVKNGYEFVLPEGAADVDAIWRQKPTVVDLGERKQGEGVSYGRDGFSLYATSEKKNTPLIQIRRSE